MSKYSDKQLQFTSEVPKFLQQYKGVLPGTATQREDELQAKFVQEEIETRDISDEDEKPQIVELKGYDALDEDQVKQLLSKNPDLGTHLYIMLMSSY
jgi:hypothetical protein